MSENRIEVPTLAAMAAAGKEAEILFWVGCAGSFDERAKKITKAFVKILHKAGVSFAVLVQKKPVLEILLKEQEMNFYFKCRQPLILLP